MMRRGTKIAIALGIAVLPAIVFANSGALSAVPNPPLKRTGAAVDGGLTCAACHAGAAPNSDPRGKLTILAENYRPGVKQTIRVKLEHPEASRWGFQLTARAVNDETKSVGVFTQDENVLVRCDDGTVRGGPSPCGGRLEFAMHTLASTRAGTRQGVEWLVDWTPPSEDVSDIIFYAAGNAANNSSNSQGDIIYTTSLRIQHGGPCTLTTRPTVRGVASGASFQAGASLNSFISLFGAGFTATPAERRQAGAGDIREGRFPTQLGCIAVEVGGQRAPITYLQGNQINAQAPALTLLGPVPVRVIANPGSPNELRSDAATVEFGQYLPALFTFDGTRIAATHADGSLVGDPARVPQASPARPGEIITIYGTGFGVTQPFFQPGEIVTERARLRDPFSVTIGGVTLAESEITYAGLSPGSISALYQINVRVPTSAEDGEIPVVVTVGGRPSQSGAVLAVKR